MAAVVALVAVAVAVAAVVALAVAALDELGMTPISSLATLRQAIAGIANYDGLYADLPGHLMRRVYRNRALQITGRVVVPFVVAG